MRSGIKKPLIRYRFKDDMGCVFFKTFNTDHEARLWYERNKVSYEIREFGSMGIYTQGITIRLTANG